MNIAFWVLSGLLVAIFGVTGVAHVVDSRWSQQNAEHLGLTRPMSLMIGVLHICAAAGLVAGFFFRPVSAATATALIVLMMAAIRYHLRAKDGAGKLLPAVATGLMAACLAGLALS